MHGILREELMAMSMGGPNQGGPTGPWSTPALPPPGQGGNDETWLQEMWRVALRRCFSKTEVAAMHTCFCGSVGFQCGCNPGAAAFCGTTAVVVVLTGDHIVVVNCVDSRAVLYRGSNIVPISFDHKV